MTLPELSAAELLDRAKTDFANALAGMPFGQDRLAAGQQFNCYESGDNEEGDDPLDWEYYLSLGPITNHCAIMRVEGEWRAKLIEAALRVALRSHCTGQLVERDGVAGVVRCLGFFASVIKSGEPWTDTCEREYRAALTAIKGGGDVDR